MPGNSIIHENQTMCLCKGSESDCSPTSLLKSNVYGWRVNNNEKVSFCEWEGHFIIETCKPPMIKGYVFLQVDALHMYHD